MTLPQWLSVATLAGMMALFLWGRFRYDVTAIIALLAALLIGVVKPADAFKGFADDIVIIVGSALVMSAAVQRSGVIEIALGFVSRRVKSVRSQLLVLTASVGVSSALVKNVGALAMLMPAAFQIAKKGGTNPSVFLMPMSFASLLGGLMTLVGTSPNIIVSRVREDMTGEPFAMFDYFPTGFGLLVVGLIFLRFGYRLLPRDRRAAPTMGEALNISGYVTEASVVEDSPAIGETIAEFIERHDNEVVVTSLLRGDMQGTVHPNVHLREDDVLILSGEPDALERVIARDRLVLTGEDTAEAEGREADEIGVIEAVVTTDSVLIGRTAGRLSLRKRFGINLIAVSRAGEHLTRKIGQIVLQAGDVIVLQGPVDLLPDRLRQLGALPLAARAMRLGKSKRGWLPIAILAAAMVATATGLVPVAVAFFAAAGLVIITGALPVDEAYEAVEWPILIMLAALIPVSESLQTSGASNVIATGLAQAAAVLPPWGAVALILVAAMAVTPFLNNAATVLVMAPIAAVFANDLGYRPEAFLIATAMGAGCDFLTPIGHQCNTLVFGPGGYRFGDYARLGAPLSLLVVIVGTPLILWTWPLH
ncbi:SLC13 family permease [Sphingobium sp. BS19]|jgi:di/tricarboxylate transporter|uniref:SLC13 family permease n=1 Tax=Sphingobium sp. BS19 TaxID=3018973 RepID=UPI0022EE98B3|nr:SLC13 family permease [Sphingobium sp. BS19]GLI96479.1 permease [Sphingobium sp. BS19]|tara:strand:- start:27623 stop:29398 length:1776 start_codon:yes stop_codon:yes gene_type:complete